MNDQNTLESFLLVQEERILQLGTTAAKAICEIGYRLDLVYRRLAHQQFKEWVAEKINTDISTALKYMRIYKKFNGIVIENTRASKNLGLEVLNFLSYDDISDEVIEKTIDLAKTRKVKRKDIIAFCNEQESTEASSQQAACQSKQKEKHKDFNRLSEAMRGLWKNTGKRVFVIERLINLHGEEWLICQLELLEKL